MSYTNYLYIPGPTKRSGEGESPAAGERIYMKRLEEAGTTDPRNFPYDVGSKDVTTWSEVDIGKIFALVLSTKEHGTGIAKVAWTDIRSSLILIPLSAITWS